MDTLTTLPDSVARDVRPAQVAGCVPEIVADAALHAHRWFLEQVDRTLRLIRAAGGPEIGRTTSTSWRHSSRPRPVAYRPVVDAVNGLGQFEPPRPPASSAFPQVSASSHSVHTPPARFDSRHLHPLDPVGCRGVRRDPLADRVNSSRPVGEPSAGHRSCRPRTHVAVGNRRTPLKPVARCSTVRSQSKFSRQAPSQRVLPTLVQVRVHHSDSR